MTMRRISVLLVAVVMMLTMAMGTALADHGNRKVCIERKNRNDIQINDLTRKEQNRILDRRDNAVRGACDDGRGGGFNIGKVTAKKTTAPWR
jgi:hypothetical protein